MRKSFIMAIAGAALLLAGCQKQGGEQSQEQQVSVNILAELASDGTKAAIDGDGAGIYADRCRLQIYMKKSAALTRMYDSVADVSDFKAKFSDICLIKGQTYYFLFWADNKAAGYYNTDDLSCVTLKSAYVGNDDKRDAFFACIKDTLITQDFTTTVTLTRPFAQLNVITTDISDIHAQCPKGVDFEDIVPNKVSLSYTAPTTFNVYTADVSGSAVFTWEAPVYTQPYKTGTDDKNTLSMDYIFASQTVKDVSEITFVSSNDRPTGIISPVRTSFSNIPLQRNYRTNIIGKLLTNTAEISVEIDPVWSGTYEK